MNVCLECVVVRILFAPLNVSFVAWSSNASYFHGTRAPSTRSIVVTAPACLCVLQRPAHICSKTSCVVCCYAVGLCVSLSLFDSLHNPLPPSLPLSFALEGQLVLPAQACSSYDSPSSHKIVLCSCGHGSIFQNEPRMWTFLWFERVSQECPATEITRSCTKWNYATRLQK